jgi:hypothetical protein
MPPQHLEFLTRLHLTFTCGDFLFVHASVRPGIPLSQQRESDLLWIREEFLQSQKKFGKYIVHSHTPVRSAEVLANRPTLAPAPTPPEILPCSRYRAAACWLYEPCWDQGNFRALLRCESDESGRSRPCLLSIGV